MYDIECSYTTGDSFNSWNTFTRIGPFKSLDLAKENLKRIKKHYEIYQHEQWDKSKIDFPNFIKRDNAYLGMLMLEIKYDDTTMWIMPDWCGYFERLLKGEIVLTEPEKDNECSFEI